jgi:RimJ/RimL family protein N-acetyltransferase
VLEYEFGTGGAPRLRATCDVANPASAGVMEKAGMRREKPVFDAGFEGNWDERHHYATMKAEYEVWIME